MPKKLLVILLVLVLLFGAFYLCFLGQESDKGNWTKSSENLLKLKKTNRGE